MACRRVGPNIHRRDRHQATTREERRQVLLEAERQDADRAPLVRGVVGEEIGGRLVERDTVHLRRDRGAVVDEVLAFAEQFLGVCLPLAAGADADRAARHLVLDPPDRLLANLDRVAGRLTGPPRRGRVQALIADDAEADLALVDRPHESSFSLGWRSRISRTTPSTARSSSTRGCASTSADRRKAVVSPVITGLRLALASHVRTMSGVVIGVPPTSPRHLVRPPRQ